MTREIRELYEVCEQIKNVPSRLAKKEIIDGNLRGCTPLFADTLLFLYDSNITTGIDIKKLSKLNNESLIAHTPFNNLIDLYEYIKEHNTGRDNDILTVKKTIEYLSDGDENIKNFLNEIITKSLKLGIDAKTINSVCSYNFIPVFEVQLGTPIEKVKLKGDEKIFISQKLNGTRCVFYNNKLWSRSGKEYTGCQHIINDIVALCEKLNIIPQDIVFDGELILKPCGLSDSEAFQKGTGIATSHNETKEELEYVIFDTISADDFVNKNITPIYSERCESLLAISGCIIDSGFKNIRVVPMFYNGYDHNRIWSYLDFAERNDMEGIMINLDTPYSFKRTKDLIKVKKFYDVDLTCVDIENSEKGKYKNTLGAIVCKYKNGFVKVGSGFTDEMRDRYWNNPEEIVGKIVSVKYKEMTKNKDGSESLQFPVFLAVREDKTEPDF